ncbi:MAG: cytochrome c oxidase subunit II [Bryobacteraceae bacterium]
MTALIHLQRFIPLFPESASTSARAVDNLYFFLVAITVFFSTVIFVGVTAFAIRYRRRDPRYIPHPVVGGMLLEATWTIIPFLIAMVIFAWGAQVYFSLTKPPRAATEVYVVGKQWMWKIQHPDGQREINELHVPVGEPVRLTMTTQDVIHSFYIPAFRVKRDVIPGMYTNLWFEATKPGVYHLFCAEYCGNQHSGMIGKVHVLERPEYERWLAGALTGRSMAEQGQRLFMQLGCATCHRDDVQGRCPMLRGVFGSTRLLTTGERVLADEQYIRESILNPRAKVVAGFEPVMPTFEGQVSEEGLLALIAYIKSLSPEADGAAGEGRGAAR